MKLCFNNKGIIYLGLCLARYNIYTCLARYYVYVSICLPDIYVYVSPGIMQ